MRFRKVITKRIDHDSGGVSVVGGLRAVVAANVNERGVTKTSVSTRQKSNRKRRSP